MTAIKKISISLCITFISLISQPIQWERSSLSISYDRLQPQSITVSDSNKMFVSSFRLGLYRSLDGGGSWNHVNIETEQPVREMKVNPKNKHLYFHDRDGLYHCDDEANLLSIIYIEGKFENEYIYSLEISPEGNLHLSSAHGIHKSTDGGLTWSYLPTEIQIRKLFVVSDNLIYCLGIDYNIENNTYYYPVFKLINGDSLVTLAPPPNYIGEAPNSIVLSSNNIVFVSTSKGVYRTSDDGISWTTVYKPNNYSFATNNMIIDPEDNIFISASNSSKIFRSTDLGETWVEINKSRLFGSGLLYADQNNRLFCCTNSKGVFVSETEGDSWDFLGPVAFAEINDISISKNNQINIVSKSVFGVHSSTDRGKAWIDHSSDESANLSSFYFLSSISSHEDLLIASGTGGAFVSTDNGTTWTKNGNPNRRMLGSTVTSDNTLFYVHSKPDAYQANITIVRSTDKGHTWGSVISDSYSFGNIITTNGNIYALVFYSDRLGYVTSIIIRSKDNGETWDEIYFSSTEGLDPERLSFIGSISDGTLFCSSDLALYRSTDEGDNWLKIDSVSTHSNLKDFTSDTLGNIYAYNSNGLFISEDIGFSWKLIDTNYSITSLTSDYDGYLFMGTESQGLFTNAPIGENPYNSPYNPIDTISTPDIPSMFSLMQNYPNPFNGTTIITYGLPAERFVTLNVYDLLGREVKTLVEKKQQPGTYNVSFSSNGLSNGVYFYRLETFLFSDTKKIVVLK